MSASALAVHNHLNHPEELAEMRSWVGQRMVLKRKHLKYAAGTKCQVMCVVDFGDELLLWIITDDEYSMDIDQLDLPTVNRLFSLGVPTPKHFLKHSDRAASTPNSPGWSPGQS